MLKTQLILKKVISEEDRIQFLITYNMTSYKRYFAELKQSEMMRERIQLVNEMRDMSKYFSVEYMRKNVLKQSESEIAEMQINKLNKRLMM